MVACLVLLSAAVNLAGPFFTPYLLVECRLSYGQFMFQLACFFGAIAFSLASAIVHDTADAEEVVAEVFSQVWRTASSFDAGRGSVVAWVSTIARTRSLDLIRSQKRRARIMDEAAAMSSEVSPPAAMMPRQ